jgi:hypothetical protein
MSEKILKKIKRISEIRKEIQASYSELNELQKDIVKEIVESKQVETYKSIDISEEEHMDLVWAFDKRIDYDRLKKDHPIIYEIGLQTTWSKTQALNAIDNKMLLETVLGGYTTLNGEYKVKISKKKKPYKRKPIEVNKLKVEVE